MAAFGAVAVFGLALAGVGRYNRKGGMLMAKRAIAADRWAVPAGYFNFAEAYLESARALAAIKLSNAAHAAEPANLLYCQAIELYLKAFLRAHGHTPIQLASRTFGHDYRNLADRAEELGLRLKVRDKLALRYLKDTDAMANARYLEVGFVRQIPHGRLDQICRGLRQRVGTKLKAKGESVRWVLPVP
jgi:hypothetical protein